MCKKIKDLPDPANWVGYFFTKIGDILLETPSSPQINFHKITSSLIFLLLFCLLPPFCLLLPFWQSLKKKRKKEKELRESYDPVRKTTRGQKYSKFCMLHSLIRGLLIQSCSAGAKNFTNYVFCHPQFSGVIQNIKNRCTILTPVCLCRLLSK